MTSPGQTLQDPKKRPSNRALARLVGCSEATVRRVRAGSQAVMPGLQDRVLRALCVDFSEAPTRR